MPNFNVPGSGELASLYLTDTEILDRYVGSTLWNWGHGSSGSLGNNAIAHRSSPVQTISLGTNWKQVAAGGAGGAHVAAIKTDGSLWLWGAGTGGQMGNNAATARSSPVQTVSAGNNWASVACGTDHVVAIKTDGTLWSWGVGTLGQMGNNAATTRSSPVQTVAGGNNWKRVAANGSHSAAIKSDGTLWLWGNNNSGQLGDGTILHRSSPVQTIAGGTNWEYVACGGNHTLAIKDDGSLWVWGSNNNGQLGDNSTTNRSSPVQTVAGGNNWKQVQGGSTHSGAVKTDGSLWMWGANQFGQLADNSTSARSSPVQTIAGGLNWKQLSIGTANSTAAIKTDGSLWTWGMNSIGQLGDNSTTNRSSPVQTSMQGNNWKQVAVGAFYTAAVTYKE